MTKHPLGQKDYTEDFSSSRSAPLSAPEKMGGGVRMGSVAAPRGSDGACACMPARAA